MADSAKDIQLRELKDTVSELNKLIKSLQETVASLNAREEARAHEIELLKQERDKFKEQTDYLTKKLFGASSEKSRGDIPGQLNLFNEAEAVYDPAQAAAEEAALAEAMAEEASSAQEQKKRKPRRTNEERFKGIPVKKEYLDIPEEERFCNVCGTPLEKIGVEFVRRELEVIPAHAVVHEYYSVNYACPECRKSDTPHIEKGKDGRAHMVYGMASPSTVAWIIFQKYFNGMPLHRQVADMKQLGIQVTKQTLSNWFIKNTDAFFKPLYEYFHRKLLERQFAMADETPVQVLHEPERRAQTKSYMWLFRSGEDGGIPIIIYKYSETRAGDNAVDFLEGFKGYLMCDGYSGYNKVHGAKRTVCWAHIRRYLIDAIPKGKQLDYTQPAVQGLMYVNRLFQIEGDIKAKAKDPDAIRDARLKKEAPVVDAFLEWLEKQNPVRGTRMDKAVIYIRNRIPCIRTYLEDGRCSFSNNLSENSIRPFVVGRKGWLFCDTPAGAEASSIAYTMVEMAKANGVNVYHYLTYLLEKAPGAGTSDEDLEKLAPWNESLKQEIAQRAASSQNPN